MPELEASQPPVNDKWIKKFLQHLATDRGASAYTQRNYRQAMWEFHRWHQEERQQPPAWEQLQRDDFRAYLRFLGRHNLSRAAIRAIQAFETTGGQLFSGVGYPAVGNPVNARSGNTGLTLLGYPIWETPSMPWTPTADDTTWGVLMNPRNYVILDRVGMSIKVIPDMLNGATPSFPTGEVGIYCFWRGTARVLYVGGGRQGAIQ